MASTPFLVLSPAERALGPRDRSSRNMDGLTVYLSRILLLAVTAAAVWGLLRSGGRTRRDIVLNVALLALAANLGLLEWVRPEAAVLLHHATLAALVAHPYVLALLSDHLVVIPRPVRVTIGIGLVVGVPVVLATSVVADGLAAALVLGFFLVSETYLAVALLATARRTGGITRSRLRLAALAPAGLAGAAVVWASATPYPDAMPIASGLGHLALVVAAAATFVGFAPPRELRRIWRLHVMEDHVQSSLDLPLGQGFRPVADHLMQAAVAVTGGTRALMVLRPVEEEHFLLIADDGGALCPLPGLEGGMHTAWENGRPTLVERRESRAASADRLLLDDCGAEAVLIVPFASRQARWGLIAVAYDWSPLFPDEDVEALELLGRHSAMLLDQGRILDDQVELIQDLRLQAEALERSNEELRAFSYAVSHDIRTPIVTHMWHVEELQEAVGAMRDAPAIEQRLGDMQRNLDTMWSLTTDLLELARINREPGSETAVRLGRVLEEVVQDVRGHHPEKQVTFRFDPSRFPVVVGEEVRFRQLFSNLVGNAVKYGPDQDAVVQIDVVRTGRPPAGTFQIRVDDNGPGVPRDFREQIFQVCIRAPDPLRRKIPGTGIGLAIAKKVAHQYDGDLFVTRSDLGGARFVFEMPMLRVSSLDDAFSSPTPTRTTVPVSPQMETTPCGSLPPLSSTRSPSTSTTA